MFGFYVNVIVHFPFKQIKKIFFKVQGFPKKNNRTAKPIGIYIHKSHIRRRLHRINATRRQNNSRITT